MKEDLFLKVKNFPEEPGVYLMKNNQGEILYIGKAGNLKRRVSSYFLKSQEERIEKLLQEVSSIEYQLTDTAIEALILESNLIKKFKPKYNIREKDDKSFLYVLITNEKFPRVLLVRGKDINLYSGDFFGPFISAQNIREALKIIRKIFPYNLHPQDKIPQKRPCFDYQIGLCPGTCIGAIKAKDYKKTIKNIKLFFQGQKNKILKNLEKEMKNFAQKLEFEKAEKIKKQIFALKHIKDIALIKEGEVLEENKNFRIEGYDISNISGKFAVGSMVVFLNNKPQKSEYKKFKIKTVNQINDFQMLAEVLKRRFSHLEWPKPDLILIDGGLGQVAIAKKILKSFNLNIPVIGIAKGPKRNKNEFIGNDYGVNKNVLIQIRDEAHRFALQYHRKLRNKIK
ncbi:MAG: GIY-YIG nuclease family protein [Minisyncoccia bacterium]